jgi:hypothetical protein
MSATCLVAVTERLQCWTNESGEFGMVRAAMDLLGVALMMFAIATLGTAAVAGTPTTLGSMRFEAPDAGAGWTTKPVNGGILFQKEFPLNGETRRKSAAIIQVLGPFAGSPAALDKGFEQVAAGVEGLAKERPYRKSEGLTANGHRIRSEYRCCARVKGLSVDQHTVGIASLRSQVVLALVGLDLRDEARESADADFAALVRSVAIEPEDKPFELVPRPDDGGLTGVYTHLDTGLRPNAFGGLDYYSDSTITVFDPSGFYSTELPENGDVAAHCRNTPTDCGLYALKGGGLFNSASEIEMRAVSDDFGTLESETKPFAKQGDGLEIDGGSYIAVPAVAAGTPFEGTWRYFFAAVGSTASSSTSVSSERLLTLRRDGTFERTGWSGASGTNDSGSGTVGFTTSGSRPSMSGHYKVEGYALELAGDDGKTERLSIFAPEEESDKLLVIGGANYLKQE